MSWRGILLLLATVVFAGCKPAGAPSADQEPADQESTDQKPTDKDKPPAHSQAHSHHQSATETEGAQLVAPGNAPAAKASFPDVITSSTAYYTGGPQQGRPADGTLAEGTPVRVIAAAGSYSVVETADGIHAYVSTGAIGKDKPQLGDK